MCLLGFGIPVFIITVAHVLVLINFIKSSKQMIAHVNYNSRLQSNRKTRLATIILRIEGNHGSKNFKKFLFFKKSTLGLTKSSILLIFIFCLSWLPYTCMVLISQYASDDYRTYYLNPGFIISSTIMVKLSAVLNPLIFIFKNKFFNHANKQKRDGTEIQII